MCWEKILAIIFGILWVIATAIAHYFAVKNKLAKSAPEKISQAEKEGIGGEEKLSCVVEELKKIVPAYLRPIITEASIREIAQTIFDKFEEYAKKQTKKDDKNG